MAWRGQQPDSPESVAESRTGETDPRPRPERSKMDKLINIGKSIQIKGELTGSEDLTIDGVLDGKIHMKEHNLTVGPNGSINAEIRAKSVVVQGKLIGNIVAGEKVEVAQSGSMNGDITAPRVILADGAAFKGSIDMEGRPVKKDAGASTAARGGAAPSAGGKETRVTA
jgi:cytoskeletal protein CcmA (bactofilin family)